MTYFFPFFGFAKMFRLNVEQYNDISYSRKHLLETHPGSRGVVTNFIDMPLLYLADSSLKKDYFVNKHHYYEKHPIFVSNIKNSLIEREKVSLLLAEGDHWKRTRRIVSKTFHHDFIISNIPNIVKKTDTVFKEINDLDNVD